MLIDNLAKSNRSSRVAASAALVIIAAVATYNWTVAPHAACLSAAQQYETAAGNIAKKMQIVRSTITTKKKKLQQLRQQSAKLQSTLFTTDQAKEFFSDLQAISEETGCAVHSLTLVTNEPGPKGKRSSDNSGRTGKSARLTVVGVYANIVKLVARLRTRTQKVWIDSLRMMALNDPVQLRCDMTITIYTILDKEAALNE